MTKEMNLDFLTLRAASAILLN